MDVMADKPVLLRLKDQHTSYLTILKGHREMMTVVQESLFQKQIIVGGNPDSAPNTSEEISDVLSSEP